MPFRSRASGSRLQNCFSCLCPFSVGVFARGMIYTTLCACLHKVRLLGCTSETRVIGPICPTRRRAQTPRSWSKCQTRQLFMRWTVESRLSCLTRSVSRTRLCSIHPRLLTLVCTCRCRCTGPGNALSCATLVCILLFKSHTPPCRVVLCPWRRPLFMFR